ncbi:hypothetical protein GCM10025883_10860 [Mobilicoccus caccae]|uniref:Uncharacterized protein n=1 Tax=Mobilicoccus caccae TaxID=1859295 RepID=A0ABQ6IMT3_9MICO|nr:hypothetical protein GCM10025883_10860 [Mobilicoccus caccae]
MQAVALERRVDQGQCRPRDGVVAREDHAGFVGDLQGAAQDGNKSVVADLPHPDTVTDPRDRRGHFAGKARLLSD